jgi:hypothetical protein
MKRLVLITLALVGGLLYLNAAKDKPRTLGTIERLDPAFFDDLVTPKDAVLEILGDGYNWVEGPGWDKKAGHLLFSDVPSNSVLQVQARRKDQPLPAAVRIHRHPRRSDGTGKQWLAL